MKRFVCLIFILTITACSEDSEPAASPVTSNPNPTPTQNLHSAIKPTPKSESWWLALHNEDKQLLLQSPFEILFLGNSITFNWETSGLGPWRAHYSGRSLNMGIGSDRTQHLLWRIMDANFSLVNPRLAVVMIGTNNSNGNTNTAQEIADGIIAVCQQLQEKLPETKILLLGIFPRSTPGSVQRSKVEEANSLASEFADGIGINYLDLGHLFLNDDMTINLDLVPDTVHPNLAGYELFAENLNVSIESLID